MDNWKKVFDSRKMHEAEIVRGVLLENDIQAILINKQDSSYHFGYYEILVKQDQLLKAIKLIQDEISFG